MRREVSGLRELIEARLEGMDRTHTLLEQSVSDIRLALSQANADQEKLFGEKLTGIATKFESIQIQFAERDTRAKDSEQAMKDSAAAQALSGTTAVNAALQAQKESAFAIQQSNKEAIAKSEAGFQERIKALEILSSTSIGELRSRLDRGEGVTRGSTETRTEHRLDNGALVAYLVAAVMAVGLLLTWNSSHQQQPQVVAPAVIPVQPGPAAPR
jgi:hypothetical protein